MHRYKINSPFTHDLVLTKAAHAGRVCGFNRLAQNCEVKSQTDSGFSLRCRIGPVIQHQRHTHERWPMSWDYFHHADKSRRVKTSVYSSCSKHVPTQRGEAIKYSGEIIYREDVEIKSSNLSFSFFACLVCITLGNQVTFLLFFFSPFCSPGCEKKCDPISENAI